MRTNYITLHRFCSYKEYEQYMSGSSLHNHTDHYHGGKGGSLSRGFCFFMGDIDEWVRRLNGLVDFDVLLTVNVAPELVNPSMPTGRNATVSQHRHESISKSFAPPPTTEPISVSSLPTGLSRSPISHAVKSWHCQRPRPSEHYYR